MNWGSGPTLGLLACSGYLLCVAAVALVWRQREIFFVWMEDEFSFFRRNFSRYTAVGPFYFRRSDSRLKAFPASFLHSVRSFPHRQINRAAILLFTGVVLFLLDFYI
ncbi:MAG TPA: hypothetical protein VMH48_08190 [Methylomirabilota bacterium]|nr:hypothetical protein [Methylomirabilota bacterium]